MEKIFNYDHFFSDKIGELKADGRYRSFLTVRRVAGEFPRAVASHHGRNREIIVWCSNDYLGMGQRPEVLESMERALKDYGAGAGGTRNISGTHRLIVDLEEELAEVCGKEAALVFSSGYVANETSLSAITRCLPDCLVVSDAENHDSMIQGIRHGRADKVIVKHNSPADLERILKSVTPGRPVLFAFESVYSMSGNFSPLAELAEVARRYGAFSFLDETHAVGLYGAHGGGRSEQTGTAALLDMVQGGLGKGFGVVGGFVAGNANAIDFVRSCGNGFIFTTTIPPVVAAGALASVRYLKHSSKEREALQRNAALLKKLLGQEGIRMLPSPSHIVPVVIGDPFKVRAMADVLLDEYGVYLQPINSPTVPAGTERFRITPSAVHTPAMIADLVRALKEVWLRFEIPLCPVQNSLSAARHSENQEFMPVV